jgi:predicted RNase H-like HicB family nuclease
VHRQRLLTRLPTPFPGRHCLSFQVAIRRGERNFVAECLDFPIVTEAGSLDQLVTNIKESVSLFLKDEDLSESDLA